MDGDPSQTPTVIAIGGVPGAGKTAAARRLAADLGLPLLSTDVVGQVVQASHGIRARDAVDAYWIAYDVVFRLCEQFVGAGLSVVLDLNLGWAFQWDWLDALTARQPQVVVLPIVLRCSRAICLERIAQRHAIDPSTDAPERYRTDPKILAVFSFLEQLERPEIVAIDAGRPADEVYSVVRQAVAVARRPVHADEGWMPRARWDALVRGEGCPLCAELSQPDRVNAFGFPVADLRVSRLRLAANQAARGYCVLICRRHVREPFELAAEDQGRYWQDLMRAGRAIQAAFDPIKLNFQLLGNLVPHLHTHIVPRYYGDPAPGRPLDPGHAIRTLDPDAAVILVQRLRAALDEH